MNMALVERLGARRTLARERPPFDCIALLLQGGGALGAYQVGVYEALARADLHPDWVAGISIGAINSAIIAGNSPRYRVEQLRNFWDLITAPHRNLTSFFKPRGDVARSFVNQFSAGLAATLGVPGFFSPRSLSPWLQPAGAPEAISYYDTSAMKTTLERFIDFDRLNSGDMRFSIGAVNVTTGNFVYFDNTTHMIGPEHVMAGAALPPGFPPIEIDGSHYWDGGLVSNTPLQWVLESEPRMDTLAFQVDLWSARGSLPRSMADVMTRQKEIQYSSRTRANSDRFRQIQRIRNALSDLLDKIPGELRKSPEYAFLRPMAGRKVYNLVQLIYRSRQYEGGSGDYEFSRASMEEHLRAGYQDTVRTLRHPEVLQRPESAEGVFTFDLAVNGRE
ncbi:MAG TPA: patatin-like phospholipase family protein [Rhizomicrobium sp.]|jgi:NTE family protein|nr:patatin-like phospholipase family protein [Rhizomicrobium sp.]